MAETEPALEIDNRKDLLLLVLAASGREPVVGVTRLQKYLFLLQEEYRWHEEFGLQDPYRFAAYDFGPFDSQLYDDLQLLENAGLISREAAGAESSAENQEARRWAYDWATIDREVMPWEEDNQIYRFELTPKGEEFVERYRLDPAKVKQLEEIKDAWNRKPLQALLRWLYKKYPTWASNTKLEHLRP